MFNGTVNELGKIMKLLLLVVALCALGIEGAKEKAIKVKDKDMMRKMIIYDKVKTLSGFICAARFQ